MTDDERLTFIEVGIHKLYCTPTSIAPAQHKGKGLIHWHEELLGDYGGADCDCWWRKVTYNGRVLKEARDPRTANLPHTAFAPVANAGLAPDS